MADASLVNFYKDRRYHASEFSNVMVRPAGNNAGHDLPAGMEIRRAEGDELDLWVATVSQGFAEGQPASAEIMSIMKKFALLEGAECYVADVDGRVVGGATLAVRGRIAGLFCRSFASAECKRHCCDGGCGGRANSDASWR